MSEQRKYTLTWMVSKRIILIEKEVSHWHSVLLHVSKSTKNSKVKQHVSRSIYTSSKTM